jgi:hypothetical protein
VAKKMSYREKLAAAASAAAAGTEPATAPRTEPATTERNPPVEPATIKTAGDGEVAGDTPPRTRGPTTKALAERVRKLEELVRLLNDAAYPHEEVSAAEAIRLLDDWVTDFNARLGVVERSRVPEEPKTVPRDVVSGLMKFYISGNKRDWTDKRTGEEKEPPSFLVAVACIAWLRGLGMDLRVLERAYPDEVRRLSG